MRDTRAIVCDLYIRYSDLRAEDMNADGEARNIVDAAKRLRERVAQLGWTVGEVHVENDTRADGTLKPASAYKRKTITRPDGTKEQRVIRPAFRRMLDRLSRRAARAVIALDLDRTVRDPRDLEDLIDVCETTGANARSLSGSLNFTDGGTHAEQAMARVMCALARKSSDDTARRVSAARLRNAEAGEFHGGYRPFGFAADGVTLRRDEAALVFEAGERVLMGVPLKQIARDWRERDARTSAGGVFGARDIRQLLKRPRNAGLSVHKGTVVKTDAWEAIMPEPMWKAVCGVLDDPSRVTVPKGASVKYLGSCLFRCWCGETVRPGTSGTRRNRYVCAVTHGATTRLARSAQGEGHIRRVMDDVDTYVVDVILERLSRPDAATLLAKPGEEVDFAALAAEKASLLRGKQDLALLFSRADDRAALIAAKREIDERLDEIDDALRLSSRVSAIGKLIDAEDPRAVWDAMSLGEQRAVISEIATVEIWPTERGQRTFDPSAVRVTFHAAGDAR